MSNTTQMAGIAQTKINYKGVDGSPHEAFIWPLKRKEGVQVMHKLLTLIADVSSTGDLAAALKSLDGDAFFDLASRLLRGSVIDLKECRDLEQFDGFNGHFLDLYVITIEALKVNYPDFFSLMGKLDLTKFSDLVKEGA